MKAIGKYQVLDEIGTSAAGKTYRVRDTFRDRELALKVLDSSAVTNEEVKSLLRRELAGCADLRHPRIAKVCDLGEVEGAIYIATELLAGADLRRHFQERRVMPLPGKIELMVQVCGGLAFAHSNGIVHGNIKPSNIFVAGDKAVSILDFGIGRWLAAILAAGGKPEGLLPNYLAPEQILGQPFDARSDVFSVAVVLYELLAGKHPFPVPASLIVREIVHAEPEPLRKVDPQIPPELEQLVARALHKNPQQRLERADEFAAGLYTIAQQLQGEQPTPAAGVSTPEAPSDVPKPVEAASAALPVPPPQAAQPSAQVSEASKKAEATVIPAPSVAAPAPVPVTGKPAGVAPPPTPRPAQKSLTSVPQTAKPVYLRKRILTYAAAAVLAICIVGALVSRQNMRASQNKGQAPAAQSKSIPSSVTNSVTREHPASPPAEPVVENESPSAKVLKEQILLEQVKLQWASGKYAQAMESVNELLVANPASAEGHTWKKKIRAAQEAEAAMK